MKNKVEMNPKEKSVASVVELGSAIYLQEALALLLKLEADFKHHESIRTELPAIISHWLQNQGSAPLILGSEAGVRWSKALNDLKGSMEVKEKPEVSINYSSAPFPPTQNPSFTFIDLFAGIGGFRLALQELGGKCIFTSEWDEHAKNTYFQNYGEIPFGDIRNFTDDNNPMFQSAVPSHDILAGGFPCQAFSQAGRQLGFNEARGTLFFDILKIARQRRPRALILENVKRLKTHDKGQTFAVITKSLRELGYKVYAKVLRAYDFGVPQNRERIFIVALDRPLHFEFPEPVQKPIYQTLAGVLETNVEDRYTLTDRIYEGHKRRLREHRERGNGFGFSVFKPDVPYVNTISARYWKDGSEVLVEQTGNNPRMLTPRECARLQGFPDAFKYNDSRRQAYQQFGNSVAVPVVKAVATALLKALEEDKKAEFHSDPLEIVTL